MRRAPLGAGLLVLLSACGEGRKAAEPAFAASPAVAVRELKSPAGAGSGEPSLAATGDGQLLLSWVEPGSRGGHALRFSTRRAGEPWSPARSVAEGTSWFVNWADFPRLAAGDDGTLYAHWLEKHPKGGPYQYDVRMVRSADGGATWSRPSRPYRDETPSEHGFVSFVPASPGIGVLFLDGRETARERGAMGLRFASWAREGEPGPDVLVDPRVCDCCQTAAARTARGLLVAYRDRSESEVRDVAVVRLEGGSWSEPAYPGGEGWTIAACPVNGPALDASGERAALAWFTMAGEKAAVRAALSGDAGRSWSPPVTLDDAEPLGRVDVVLTGRGALVSWLAAAPAGAEIRAASLGEGRLPGPATVIARTSAARASGFPQLERAGGEIVAAWTEPGDPAAVRTAALEVQE